MGVRFE